MMKNFITVAALAAGTNALVGRSDSCCFHLTASGGASGEVGQLGDGQNRIGDNSLSPAQFCIDSQGAITDSNGRGCILTPPTTQLQCDEGASPTPGFSVDSQGKLDFQGSTSFVACATGQNGGLNIYTTPNQADVTGCVNVELSADTCSSSGPSPGGPSSVPSTPSAPVLSTSVPGSTPATSEGAGPSPSASIPPGGGGTPQPSESAAPSVPGGGGTPQPSESATPPPPGGGETPQPSESAAPPPPGGGETPQPSESAAPPAPGGGIPQPSESATPPPPGGSETPQPSESAVPPSPGGGETPQPSESAAPPPPSGGGTPPPSECPLPASPVTVVSTVTVTDSSCPATSPASGGSIAPPGSATVPTPSGGGVSQPSGSGSASVPASSASSNPGTGTSGGSCPPTLTKGSFESPHLIIPVDSSSPNTAPGTSFNGTVSSTISSAFNFDIPSSDAGKTCSLVFLFPELKDLETSSFTFSGDGKIDFAKLSAPADQSTSFNTMPSVSQDLGEKTVSPGNSYIISTFPCPAGQTIAFEMKSSGNTKLNFFEDWNPSPFGLFITTC